MKTKPDKVTSDEWRVRSGETALPVTRHPSPVTRYWGIYTALWKNSVAHT
jgi:hypothetical protein